MPLVVRSVTAFSFITTLNGTAMILDNINIIVTDGYLEEVRRIQPASPSGSAITWRRSSWDVVCRIGETYTPASLDSQTTEWRGKAVSLRCYQYSIETTPYVCKRNAIQIHWTALFRLKQLIPPKLNSLSLLYFACRRKKAVHLCIIMSPGETIFAVLELWLSPLQWVLNW